MYGQPGNVTAEKTGIITWAYQQKNQDPATGEVPERSLATEYRVVHKITCDDNSGYSWETDQLLGTKGLQQWSELLWDGKDTDPFCFAPGTTLNPTLDLLFRFQVPYYEQARRYLDTQTARELLDGRLILSDEGYQRVIIDGSRELEEGY
ncbi:hypothetical protein ACFVYC_18640 [Pseudarthrobacter sp. NPDC058329]|uniref:hypothetical protein n=1 Tax=Pseudarthrobacter sp. NPDC058329 TaxID=3346448 RepID=UPI0036DC3C56